MIGFFGIVIGVLHIFAMKQKWSWFMGFYQCRSIRERYGESFFAFYVYLMSIISILAGFYFLFEGL